VIDSDQLVLALKDMALTLVIIAGLSAVIEVVLYVLLVRRGKSKLAVPLMLIAPAVIGILVLYVYPLIWELNVSFTKMSVRNFIDPGLLGLTSSRNIFAGIDNYVNVFTGPVLKQTGFFQLFAQTILWTVLNVSLHVTLGIGLALMLNRRLRGRTLYRAALILPWAIPATASLQIWRTEYNFEYGAVNQLLGLVGIDRIPWLSDPVWNFAAMVITNVWLGVPFMMVIVLGGLQSISHDYYEAAEIDGASQIQAFRSITLPLLRPVLVPAILLGTFLTFNNILVPYFINQNELETSDILVTALYRAAFNFSRYGFAAALAFVIFGILLVFTIFYVRKTNALRSAYV
jgi:arabinogalactan oligomer/maltooligosaccharide transport system permease protein